MPWTCFGYGADVPEPSVPRRMPAGSCFSNMVDAPQPVSAGWLACFSYTADAPQPAPPGLRTMVFGTCFRY